MNRHLIAATLFAAGLAAQGPTALVIDTTLRQLWTVDLNTGNCTFLIQTTGVGTAADLAFREDTNELWTVDLAGGNAGVIDLVTGAFTTRWPSLAAGGWQGMAWDPYTRKFYLANQNGNNYSLEPVSGTFTLLGASGFSLITALSVDAQGTLLGIQFNGTPSLVRIDKTTGVATAIATTSPANMQGMAHHPDGRLFAVNSTTRSLYTIDQVTGNTVLVGALGGLASNAFTKGFEILGTQALNGGHGCPDGSGATRAMTASGTIAINNIFNCGIEQGPAVLPAFVLIGLSSTSIGALPLPVDLSNYGAPGCFVYSSADVNLFSLTGSTITFFAPNSPSYIGFMFFNQGMILDGNPGHNALGIATTGLQRIVVSQ
jgi:hypothetical protein